MYVCVSIYSYIYIYICTHPNILYTYTVPAMYVLGGTGESLLAVASYGFRREYTCICVCVHT